MPLAMQAKLLRVLEEGEIERIGGDKPIRVDARVVVATHRNLEEMVRQERFARDLFHRVYVFPIVLPPLRERAEEIPALADYFVRAGRGAKWLEAKELSPESIDGAAANTRGPAMCANCATWSSDCCCSPAEDRNRRGSAPGSAGSDDRQMAKRSEPSARKRAR